MKKVFILSSFFMILINSSYLFAQINIDRDSARTVPLAKAQIDDYRHFHDVGNVGLTVTNYGLLGQGYQSALQDQPSCMYKYKSRFEKERIEHFSYAGLWVGGIGGIHGEQETLVSTAIVDGVFDYGEAGFEFTNSASLSDTVRVRSSIVTSPYFDPRAISHQDFICDFTDLNMTVPGTDIELIDHTPLGIDVHLETYAWNYSYADAFVILNYTLVNRSTYPIEKLYAGLWVDASIANMNYTSAYQPGGGFTWYDNLNGFDPAYKMAYQYDADGDNGFAESYLGIRALGSTAAVESFRVYYDQWKWNAFSNMNFPTYYMPRTDEERYQKLSTTPDGAFPDEEDSWMLLLSIGSLGDLAPGDSLNMVFAIVCGFWGDDDTDSPVRRKNLRLNSEWAQIAYNGEDVDGDGKLDLIAEDINNNDVLDEGEDLDGDGNLDIDEDIYENYQRGISGHNGKIDRYILPAPPPSPKLLVIPGDKKVTLYWDDTPENYEDPITREIDFEGYRIYSAPKTAESQEQHSLLAQFDLIDNLGYDTGFKVIENDTMINGINYKYKFVNENLHSGWPDKYYFAVTSYDKGNQIINLPSLESSVYENLTYAIPGQGAEPEEDRKIYVYPNPYKASAQWDGYGERERLIWFANLPEEATIRIYTLAGDLVDEIYHHAAIYDGSDIALLRQKTRSLDVAFAGGEHGWDMISNNDQAIASGLYLYTVKDETNGRIYSGKFLVIK